MAGLDWGLLNTNPGVAQQQGFDYAQKIQAAAANRQAGQLYANGDTAGASRVLAQSGNIPAAQQTQEYGRKTQQESQKQYADGQDYLAQSVQVFQKIAEAHAGDPDKGAAALGQAFDQIAPEAKARTGIGDQQLAQFRQSLVADPQGTLARIQQQLPAKYQTVGHNIVKVQGGQITPVYEGQKDAPAGYTNGADGKSLQFIPGGPADPKTVGNLASERRMVIVNNPVPQRAGTIGGKAPAGYRWTADGELEIIPGGPADKLTDDQSKAVGYGNRLSASSDIIDKNEASGTNFAKAQAAKVPLAGNYLVGQGYQNLDQAERDFVNALLRRESGAAISESEFQNARIQYFPQPGDSKSVLEQKRAARRRGIENMRVSAGRTGADKITPAHSSGQSGQSDPLGIR